MMIADVVKDLGERLHNLDVKLKGHRAQFGVCFSIDSAVIRFMPGALYALVNIRVFPEQGSSEPDAYAVIQGASSHIGDILKEAAHHAARGEYSCDCGCYSNQDFGSLANLGFIATKLSPEMVQQEREAIINAYPDISYHIDQIPAAPLLKMAAH